jgi:hypothetical protein
MIDLKGDGSFRLDLSYFDYCTGPIMTNERFSALFGEPMRGPDKLLTQLPMDVAASIQAVLDEAVLRLTRSLAKKLVPRTRSGIRSQQSPGPAKADHQMHPILPIFAPRRARFVEGDVCTDDLFGNVQQAAVAIDRAVSHPPD